MQKTIEKLLKNFDPPLSREQRAAAAENRNQAAELLNRASERSAKLYKKLGELQALLAEQQTAYLTDRFTEGLLCGLLAGLEMLGGFGDADGTGSAPIRQNAANPHGKYYRSKEVKAAESKSARFKKALEKEFRRDKETIAELCEYMENACICEESAYRNEGMRTGLDLGINAALYLRKSEQ